MALNKAQRDAIMVAAEAKLEEYNSTMRGIVAAFREQRDPVRDARNKLVTDLRELAKDDEAVAEFVARVAPKSKRGAPKRDVATSLIAGLGIDDADLFDDEV